MIKTHMSMAGNAIVRAIRERDIRQLTVYVTYLLLVPASGVFFYQWLCNSGLTPFYGWLFALLTGFTVGMMRGVLGLEKPFGGEYISVIARMLMMIPFLAFYISQRSVVSPWLWLPLILAYCVTYAARMDWDADGERYPVGGYYSLLVGIIGVMIASFIG